MSRPTIASLENQVATLKAKIANVEDYLQNTDLDDWCVDKEDIVDQVADYLNIDVSRYQEVEWDITVRGKVKVGKNFDPSDLELTVRGLTVACANMGVDGYEYEDMEIEVDDVRFV